MWAPSRCSDPGSGRSAASTSNGLYYHVPQITLLPPSLSTKRFLSIAESDRSSTSTCRCRCRLCTGPNHKHHPCDVVTTVIANMPTSLRSPRRLVSGAKCSSRFPLALASSVLIASGPTVLSRLSRLSLNWDISLNPYACDSSPYTPMSFPRGFSSPSGQGRDTPPRP
jgi:hypothetical protein